MLSVEVSPEVSTQEWRTYVESHPEGTYYHLPGWQAVLKESLGHKPYYIFAKNEEGRLCGVLPLFHIKSALTGSRLVSLPFANACGPIADSKDTIEALVNRAKSLCDELNCRYLEIRMARPLSLGLEVNDYFFNHVIQLSEPQVMWKRIDHRARGAVSKARKSGVVVNIDGSIKGVETFYYLNLRTKTRLGVPAHPIGFFKAMSKHMNGYFSLYLAEVQGKVISGGIIISFNGVASASYKASDDNYLQFNPNDAVTWQQMEDACKKGYRCFDFGKTGPDNIGLARFKRKYGAEEKNLYYYYYPKTPHLVSSDRKGPKYRIFTGLWKRLPLPLLRVLGPVAFRQLD
jgi:FemAB-related protein (PEP-CTERM system-associated)